jgi:MoaA/NifB/PqqE/SkfB family radical SAM enzyme
MRVTENFQRSRLSVEYIKRLLDAAAQKGVKIVSFTGGEPLLFLDDLVVLINYAGEAGFKYIRTGTNGFIFRNPSDTHFRSKVTRIVEALAATPLRNFWISIDSGVPSVHETMRGLPGIIAGLEKALPIFHDYGIYPSANLGINRNIGKRTANIQQRHPGKDQDYLQAFYQAFQIAFSQFYRFIIDLGFTISSICYPMSVDNNGDGSDLKPVYAANSEEDVVRFSTEEKIWLYKALLETVPDFRARLRIISPLTSLYALCKQYSNDPERSYPCRGGIDYFFVDSKEGNTYPCGYRGNENLGRFWDLDMNALGSQATCYQCDWECFRDPSELFGPLLHGLSNPLELFKKIRRDHDYFRLWLKDLRYSRACDFFDGRKPPDFVRLRRFKEPFSLPI